VFLSMSKGEQPIGLLTLLWDVVITQLGQFLRH
jgi:hypothetical protein